ncbi:MAG: aminotransferase class V-fold PLP-dependent enzyme [Methanomassiliicoccales archaeon]|nr:aminotransferase class V-fold PLP-dependent enzyme [Methanomassiliicoccales archaeon]NYT15354.1 aminotransferase class V-fold PLP-dependent enzyme [Methanomassiliicoccales archaeon]
MDVARIRKDFPFYDKYGSELIYFDSACQTLRPDQVIDAINEYYIEYPACGGRSVHRLATQVTLRMDESREALSDFLNASPDEIAFTKNATESINIVANGYPFKKGEKILTTDIEHNSNHLPWLRVARDKGTDRVFVPTIDGIFDIEVFKEKMSREVKMVSLVHTSNVTGTTIPAKEVIEIAHDNGALVMLDGSQAAPHHVIDVRDLDVDFYALSLHKMLGPSGVGALYAKEDIQKELEPLILGGGGVSLSSYEGMDLLPPPEKFEAGLMNYAGIIGSGPAIRYLLKIGMEEIDEHLTTLNKELSKRVIDLPEIDVVGPRDPELRGGILSFNVRGMKSHDVATIFDEMGGILLRSGMHCAHPFFHSRRIEGSVRASLYIYNSIEECQRFVNVLKEIIELFAR